MSIRFLVFVIAIAPLSLLDLGSSVAMADGPAVVVSNPSEAVPERLGLIDLAYIFTHYEKFRVSQDSMKTEVASLGLKAQQLRLEAEQIKLALKQTESGSSERTELEQELVKKGRQFEDYQRSSRQSLLKKESALYKTVYFEVLDAVREVAKQQNFTLILRFNRVHLDHAESDADEVKKGLNRQVIFYRETNDVTLTVLKRLNTEYAKTKSGADSNNAEDDDGKN